ncbi:MAG TPA: hypothetical protein P5081_11005 [Phycisphaerae bacterium]|nr:hypothetical protein [Phycisphaerae bacterium]HRW53408.1 hypothetical protein [Phycisphaerae bacterium]
MLAVLVGAGAYWGAASRAAAGDCNSVTPITGSDIPTRFLQVGAPFVLQDNPTGFGDVAPPSEEPSRGNELDQLFVTNDATNLYIGITGNADRMDTLENSVLVFIDTDFGAVPMTLDTAGCCADNTDLMGLSCGDMVCESCVAAISISCDVNQPFYEWSDRCQEIAMNECLGDCSCDLGDPATQSNALREVDGLVLDFDPDFAVAIWNVGGVQHGVLFDLSLPANSAGTALTEGVDFAVNNENLDGVNTEAANDPLLQQANAASAQNGFEIHLPLATLGVMDADEINIQAIIANGVGTISNQSLPPLNRTDNFVVPATGGGVVNPGDPSPTNVVDFNFTLDPETFNDKYPGLQHVTYTIDAMAAAPTGGIDGVSIPSDYPVGALLATQNNFTGFGDAEEFSPFTTDGSELNQMFVWSDLNKLYIGITGNIPADEGFNNHILIFLDTVPFNINFIPNNLSTGNPVAFGDDPALQGMDQFVFDDDFTPDLAIQYDRGGNQHHADIVEFEFGLNTPLTFSTDTAVHTGGDLSVYSADLSNIAGVNGIVGDDPLRQEDAALTATSGVQFSILLSDLGLSPGQADDIKIAAMIAGGTGFVSNQWLPPLNETGATLLANESAAPMATLSDAAPGDLPDTAVSVIVPDDAITQGLSRVTGIEVTLDITHPDMSELAIDLWHTGSDRTVRLWDRNVAGANMNTTFVVGGEALENWVAPGNSVDYESAQTLLTFNDANPTEGEWFLFITDFVNGNTGTLNSWSIALRDDLGGAIACPGFVADQLPAGIDLGEAPYTGAQYATVSVPVRFTAPSSFSSQGIPAAFSALSGSAVAVQNNYTCFEDTIIAPPMNPPGSEMDAMFVTNTDNRLRVGITGNLENNRNAFILLLDTDSMTGSETPSGITPPPDALGGNGGEPGVNQFQFDTSFGPEYALTVQARTGNPELFDAYLTTLATNTSRFLGVATRNSGDGTLTQPPPILNTGGSELNQMFVQNDADNLYVGVTGNLEGNGNAVIVLVDTNLTSTPAPALATNNPTFPGPLQGVNGDIMDDDFVPEYALVLTTSNNTLTLVDLTNGALTTLTQSASATPPAAPNIWAIDNLNFDGVNSNAGEDDDMGSPPSQQILNARTATQGLQLAIDRASLAGLFPAPSDGSDIRIMAFVGSGDGFWSNQVLPGLGGNVGNLGNGPNLSTQAGTQFATYTMKSSGAYTAPAGFDGSNIPSYMGDGMGVDGAIATQDTFTQFGNQSSIETPTDNPLCLQIAFDDSNVFGVTDSSAAAATTAETGMEFDIPFGDIGMLEADGVTEIKLLAYVAGQFGYLSNQFLPPLGRGDAPNLGNPGLVNLSDDAVGVGAQYFTYTLETSNPCGANPADITGDGVVDITSGDPSVNDITAFVDVLLGVNTDTCPLMKADVDNSGAVDGLDAQAFIDALLQ